MDVAETVSEPIDIDIVGSGPSTPPPPEPPLAAAGPSTDVNSSTRPLASAEVIDISAIPIPEALVIDAEAKKKRDRKEAAPKPVVRPPGKSLLPISKVQNIIKADKEITLVAKEATFLVACATEEFMKRFAEAAMAQAEREKRTTLQYKDMATVVRKADEFLFLEEIIPWTLPDAPVKRRVKTSNIPTGTTTMLDQFVVRSNTSGMEESESQMSLNEDGTMGEDL
ncbi:histone-fold-containing protein [Mycena amicta]|nr:histone-fold-containing protein [Mycena amicta]